MNTEQLLNKVLHLSRSDRRVESNQLEFWNPTIREFCKEFSNQRVVEDKKSAGYIVRAAATIRKGSEFSKDANILILDADSHCIESTDKEGIDGAVDPLLVHRALNYHKLNHLICTSHSNEGIARHKYRVFIFVDHTKEQLPSLLQEVFARLHARDVMLFNARENDKWGQPWFLPSAPASRSHLAKTFWRIGESESNPVFQFEVDPKPFDVEQIYSAWLIKESALYGFQGLFC